MRTDTRTFRDNAFKSLRRQGVNSAKSREIVGGLAFQFAHLGHPVLADTTEITVSLDGPDQQSVAVVDQGLVTLHLDRHTLRGLQPLVDCEPTPRQLEIADELRAMIPGLYEAIADGCDAWDAENGRSPVTDDDFDDRSDFCRAFPACVEINGRYDALKAESLAINPNVDAFIVDPDKASHWYDWVQEARGYRPTGFMTLAMVEADMASLPREIADETAPGVEDLELELAV